MRSVYTPTQVDPDRREARRAAAADRIAAAFADPTPTLRTAGYFAEVAAAIDRRGANVLVDLDDAIWNGLAAVGDPDDVEALHAAGGHRGAFSPAADRSVIRDQLSRLLDTVVGPRRGTSASESAATN